MAQVLKPSTLINQTVQAGEITINLNLTIKLDSDGLAIKAEAVEPKPQIVRPIDMYKIEEEDPELMIPDFDTGEMIDFGRKVE